MLAPLLALLVLAQEAPAEMAIPSALDRSKPWKLQRISDGKEIPVQVSGDAFVFLASTPRDDVRIVPGPPAAFPAVDCLDDGRSLTLSSAGRNILRYHYAPVPQPDPDFTRSGYIHPLWTPSGRILTNDSPPHHLHHHGLWSAWTSSEFEGRKSNFWESKEKQGRVECVKVEDRVSGPVFAGFRARHRFINLNGPGGETPVLDETWELRAYALSTGFVVDLVSTQTCATEHPLLIREYRYGGIGFRGSADWEGKDGTAFLTSEGKTRADGHATKARWCIESGRIGGADASIAFLCHPADFRFPQPMRIHPDEPFFNWAVPQGGDFSIEPGQPYVARYRFLAADGRLGREVLDAAWSAYAEPSRISVRVVK